MDIFAKLGFRLKAFAGAIATLMCLSWAPHANAQSYLRIIQDDTLWDVEPSNGSYAPLGGAAWAGATSMAMFTGLSGPVSPIYVIQDSKLWQASATTGSYTRV